MAKKVVVPGGPPLTPLQHVLNALGAVKGHAVGMPTPPAASFDVDKVINDQLKVQSQRLEVLKNIVGREAVLNKTVTFAVESSKAQQVIQDKITAALRTRSEKILGATGVAAGLGGLGGIGGVGGAIGGLVGGVGGAAAGGAVASALAGFVKAANPAAMQRFDLVLRDVAGTIGQSLIPVIDALIPFVKLFGDFLASILPSADEVQEALAPLGELLGVLRSALEVVAPVIHDVLVVAFKALGVVLEIVLVPLRLLADFLTDVFGLGGGKKLADSTGKGFRGAQFQQQEQFAHSIYQAALMAPPGAKEKGEYHSPLEGMWDTLKDISGILGGALSWLVNISKGVWETVVSLIPDEDTKKAKEATRRNEEMAARMGARTHEQRARIGQGLLQLTPEQLGQAYTFAGILGRMGPAAPPPPVHEAAQMQEARQRALDGWGGFSRWMFG